MTSPHSSSKDQESVAFYKLHEKVQRWLWEQNWTELRDAQEAAVSPILSANTDVIISASTAAGKTEAAFLPIFSKLIGDDAQGIQCLYVSPLKALINDQYDRLSKFGETLDIAVFKWHGDVSSDRKKKFLKKPSKILIITPESLEAIFMIHGTIIPLLFRNLQYVVIDELHSFIGTERGRQLQSLLHRVETVTKKRIPRIGLSATLGNMDYAKEFLRPNVVYPFIPIKSSLGKQDIHLQVRGYESPNLLVSAGISVSPPPVDEYNNAVNRITEHLFSTLRGNTNLIFTNQKAVTEIYTAKLTSLCDLHNMPREFYPHHGNLSKAIREETETFLKDKSRPATAICTATLEMGIDIGTVKSIAQIGTPPSVSSLRQRLGRSGRRGEPSILRIYITEEKMSEKVRPQDSLRAELFQTIAVVNLLLEGWVESPNSNNYHFSTLIQQILSMICQYGAVNAYITWKTLCETGPFDQVSSEMFSAVLRSMGEYSLINQTTSGEIVLGWAGERLVNDYDFYSAFTTPDEYKLYADNNFLGTMPIFFPPVADMFLIFAGKYWKVTSVDSEKMIVYMIPAKGGKPPVFYGAGINIDSKIREGMYQIYRSNLAPKYLNVDALKLFDEGVSSFNKYGLFDKYFVQLSNATMIFPWCGDKVMYTLALFLITKKFKVEYDSISLTIHDVEVEMIADYLSRVIKEKLIDSHEMALKIEQKVFEKHDKFLNEPLRELNFITTKLDVPETYCVLDKILKYVK